MKKVFLVLLIGLLAGTAAFADHPDGLGIGIVGGGGGGFLSRHGYGNVGVSFKIPKIPIYWAAYGLLGYYPGLGVTADFYFLDKSLVDKQMTNEDGTYHFKLDWYLGVGAFLHLNAPSFFDVGVRIPVGLSWHIIRQLELFLDIAPGLGLGNWRLQPFHFGADAELGLRLWF